MALRFPSSLHDAVPPSEVRTYEALSALDDTWRLFHSVVWQGLRHGRQADGEADFVLMNPRYGIIVLEVKGGRVEVEGGTWYSVDRDNAKHRIKNPFTQAA